MEAGHVQVMQVTGQLMKKYGITPKDAGRQDRNREDYWVGFVGLVIVVSGGGVIEVYLV